ncbi:MAG: hypothetical protein U1F54_12150 [Burkholderiales bacterium]
MTTAAPVPFTERLRVVRLDDAAYFAGPLFEESFKSAFPVPPKGAGWAQYVAFYRWAGADGDRIEPVGFCNFLPFESLWLEGGLCVRRDFYGRLASPHAEQCRAAGGVAQLIMEQAARDLADCDAWFAYIGDPQSLKVCTRVGYQPTGRGYVMVRWFRDLDEDRRTHWIERVAALGPF